ncbi:MAG: excinuclease ABC subunit UvrA, partial [Rikenellaceae bacterium]
QRRYMETLSTYARQFVGNMERPEVDNITGLGPVISIEQKTTNKNPRSTVGTVTEINDFLRLLYARASTAFSPATGQPMSHSSEQSIVELIKSSYDGCKIALMAPMVKGRKGHYRELIEEFLRKGFLYARIDGAVTELYSGMRLDRYKTHNIELVVDRIAITGDQSDQRLATSLKETLRQGKGMAMVYDYETGAARYYSRNLMCPQSGMAIDDPAPHTFSFNSPHGACPHCGGLGDEAVFDRERIIPDMSKSIAEGAIEPLGKHKNNLLFATLAALGKRYDFELKDPIDTMSEEAISAVLNGDSETFTINTSTYGGSGNNIIVSWDGVGEYIDRMEEDSTSTKGSKWKEQFLTRRLCSACNGSRLRPESLYFRFDNKTIAELSNMSIMELSSWLENIEQRIGKREATIAVEILKEIRERLGFLVDVGLGYLSLSRSSRTLSGGESQRIRLATQIGSKLINVLYILDEPSIGLHQDDNHRLIESLKALRDAGNSVIVVEHDDEMIRSADWVVDVGPGAGRFGGKITASGTYKDILKSDSITAEYMSGRRKIEIPTTLRDGNGKHLTIKGARGHNLKNIDVSFPLAKMICVTGMSGSGKSSLINDTLRAILSRELYNSYDIPLEYDSVEGIENIDKMVVVDQAPIGRSPRSNPATYTGVFSDIRKLFESTPDAQIRGFKAGRFSFNVKGGRCE